MDSQPNPTPLDRARAFATAVAYLFVVAAVAWTGLFLALPREYAVPTYSQVLGLLVVLVVLRGVLK